MVDKDTSERSKIACAELLIEIELSRIYQTMLCLFNEKDKWIDQGFICEWKPRKCTVLCLIMLLTIAGRGNI